MHCVVAFHSVVLTFMPHEDIISDRSIYDLVETGKSNVLFDEMDFRLQLLNRLSDFFLSDKKSAHSRLTTSGDIKNIRCEIDACVQVIRMSNSVHKSIDLLLSRRQTIISEVVAPCLLHSIDFAKRKKCTSYSLRCLQECLLCIILLFISAKDEEMIENQWSNRLTIDPRTNISPALLILLCHFRPEIASEDNKSSIRSSESCTQRPSDSQQMENNNIHKKRKKIAPAKIPPSGNAPHKECTGNEDDDSNVHFIAFKEIATVLSKFDVFLCIPSETELQRLADSSITLYEFISLILISRFLNASVQALSSISLSAAGDHTEDSPPTKQLSQSQSQSQSQAMNPASLSDSMVVIQSLLRVHINGSIGSTSKDSYLSLLWERYLKDDSHQKLLSSSSHSQPTLSRRLLLPSVLSIIESACFQCPENQVHIID